MSRKPIVGGNWKSNPATKVAIEDLIGAFNKATIDPAKVEVVVAATALHIPMVMEKMQPTIKIAAQNCSKEKEGAFTGEITCTMMKDMGLEWTLIGHSERRHKYGETNADMALKVEKALAAGISVIFCIGELLEERQGGKTNEVCKEQLLAVIPKISDWSKVVIAYEPVWAIGTGVVATPEQAQETQKACREIIAEAAGAEVAAAVRIQYGGSVTPDNCAELMACPDVDGFLVGGASLKPSFMDIVSTVEKAVV
mmetsp:Transcript_19865/g.50107  ORF Transcript_19865/g.50107 Transcript_19865/m.50107 type:complete len:254 (-) Transcript_19865:485-1246(-)|eukprot:CAMPEP_0179000154 /NCGR_PEP_ID=MMETSP0795-20121207/10496_1 /TAXON_ID=88552 /ORGANISM="Amoebophrya sp., Strain Ameob2" /LENGTH=253 /DNA_ID=CAMNT_0020693083 /DNA_START=179 /DNA_END=940 /DNA_ORIENTATION=+